MEKKETKCMCNPVWLVVIWVLLVVGIWALVGGFAVQLRSEDPTALNTTVMTWYFIGVILMSLAKIVKYRLCCVCTLHK